VGEAFNPFAAGGGGGGDDGGPNGGSDGGGGGGASVAPAPGAAAGDAAQKADAPTLASIVARPSTATAPPAPAASAPDAPAGDVVLLDGDFLAYTRGLPLPLAEESKRALDAAIRRDTEFLCRVNVVDYSVLIGLEPEGGRMVAGVIDYIRRFDLAKQLESRMKSMTSLATNVEPTVIQPERYEERLQRALERYFVAAPDYFSAPAK